MSWNRPFSRKNLKSGWASWKCHCILCEKEWWQLSFDGTEFEVIKCPFCNKLMGIKDFEYDESQDDRE